MADYSGSVVQTDLKMEVDAVDDDGCSQSAMGVHTVRANADEDLNETKIHNFASSPENRTLDDVPDIKVEIKQENTSDDFDYNTPINNEFPRRDDKCLDVESVQSDKLKVLQECNISDDEQTYWCVVCGKGFEDDVSLLHHTQTHLHPESEVAEASNLDPPSKYRASFVKIKSEDTSAEPDTNDADNSEENMHWCSDCGEVFKDEDSLLHHKETYSHIETEVAPWSVLETGNSSDGSDASVREHIRKHATVKTYKCKQCGKCFTQSSNLTEHMRTHTGEKPFPCKHCDKCFTCTANLTRHMRTHTGVKPYKCKHCDKCFARHSILTCHMRTHTGEKPYKCNHCDKCFAQTSSLIRHVRTHTAEKPYKCKHCDKCFTRTSHLARHIPTHTGEKPYTCKHCDKCFHHRGILARHMLTHTGEKPYKCKH